MKEVISHLMSAPDSQLDAAMKPYIEKWSDPPTSLQVLEVLDHCVHGALASGFVMQVLNTLYDQARERDNISHEEVVKNAIWRNERYNQSQNTLNIKISDVDSFLNQLYLLELKKDRPDTLDFIYDHCYGDYSIMEEIYSKIDLTKLGISSMISFLICTFTNSDNFPTHAIFYNKAVNECLARGETIEHINSMFKGLINEGKHHKNMKVLN